MTFYIDVNIADIDTELHSQFASRLFYVLSLSHCLANAGIAQGISS